MIRWLAERKYLFDLSRLRPVALTVSVELTEQREYAWMFEPLADAIRIRRSPAWDERLHRLVCLPRLTSNILQDDRFELTLAVGFPRDLVRCERIWPNAEEGPPDTFGYCRANQGTLSVFKRSSGLRQVPAKLLVFFDLWPRKGLS